MFYREAFTWLFPAEDDEELDSVRDGSCFQRTWPALADTRDAESRLLAGISRSSNLQNTAISNRPRCVLIHSLASNTGHQQICKGRSPTEKHAQNSQINHLNKCDLHLIALNLTQRLSFILYPIFSIGWCVVCSSLEQQLDHSRERN